MQVCVYPVPAISAIRPEIAVEHGNAGVCLPSPGDFGNSSRNRCGPWKCQCVSTQSWRFQQFVRKSLWSMEMQGCVYPVSAISAAIRLGIAVEHGNAGCVSTQSRRFQQFVLESLWSMKMQGCVYPVSAISAIRPEVAVEHGNGGVGLYSVI